MSQPEMLKPLWDEAKRRFSTGEYKLAITAYSRIIAEAEVSSETINELAARVDIIAVYLNAGDYESAIHEGTRLLARARQADNEKYKTWACLQLGIALAKLDLRNRWEEIEPLLLEGLATARALKDSYLESYHLARLGGYSVRCGGYDRGFSWLQAALDSIPDTQSNARWVRSDVYSSLATLMTERHNLPEALRYAEMSLAEMEAYGNLCFIADSRVDLARVHYACGQYSEARHLLPQTLEDARSNGWLDVERKAEDLSCMIERHIGNLEASASAGRRSLTLARQMQMKEEEVKALISLSETLRRQGLNKEASGALHRAQEISREKSYGDLLGDVTSLLSEISD